MNAREFVDNAARNMAAIERSMPTAHETADALVERLCVYTEEGCEGDKIGTAQCPYCKQWYCPTCAEMFLDRVPDTDRYVMRGAILPKPICPQCHYERFWRPALG